jgi:hypothetical protein
MSCSFFCVQLEEVRQQKEALEQQVSQPQAAMETGLPTPSDLPTASTEVDRHQGHAATATQVTDAQSEKMQQLQQQVQAYAVYSQRLQEQAQFSFLNSHGF